MWYVMTSPLIFAAAARKVVYVLVFTVGRGDGDESFYGLLSTTVTSDGRVRGREWGMWRLNAGRYRRVSGAWVGETGCGGDGAVVVVVVVVGEVT